MDYFEVALEADRRLREKFGPLVTDWKPTAQNCLFLAEKAYRDKFGFKRNYQKGLWHKSSIHIETKTMYFMVPRDLTRNELLSSAVHEMLHLHSGNREIPFMWDHKDEFKNQNSDERFSMLRMVTDVIVVHLTWRTLGDLGTLEALSTSPSRIGVVIRVIFDQIVSLVGEKYDRELYLLLGGERTEALSGDFEELFGEGSFQSVFLELVEYQARADYLWGAKGLKLSNKERRAVADYFKQVIEIGRKNLAEKGK